jgi:hypothetical protein
MTKLRTFGFTLVPARSRKESHAGQLTLSKMVRIGSLFCFAMVIGSAAQSDCTSPVSVGAYTVCNETYNYVSSGTSVSADLSPTAGNGVEVVGSWCCATPLTQTATVSDNVNSPENCFTASPHSPYNLNNIYVPDYERIYVWYCPSIPAGVTSFTVTTSASTTDPQIDVIEWKAGSIASFKYFESVDQLAYSGDTAGTTATIPTSGSTVYTNDLVTALVANCGAQTAGIVGIGYLGINVNPSGVEGHIFEAKAASSAGIQTATMTWDSPASLYNCDLGAGGNNDTWFGVIVPLISVTPALPTVTLSPISLNFGHQVLDTTSAAKSVTLKNAETTTLDISSITSNGDFAISTNACGTTLAVGKTCKVRVTFTPTELGALTGTLAATDDAANSPQTVTLAGTGVVPATLIPASATYAAHAVDMTSPPKTFILHNEQTVALTGIVISTTGDFAVSATTCTTSLAAQDKCTIGLTFTPTETGTRTGQLSISDSANNTPQAASLTGTGR